MADFRVVEVGWDADQFRTRVDLKLEPVVSGPPRDVVDAGNLDADVVASLTRWLGPDEAARRAQVEAEASVARVRALADGLETAAAELDADGAPHAVGEAAGMRAAAYRVRVALDGPAASDG